MEEVPKGYEEKIVLASGGLGELTDLLASQGYSNLYIDGGITIQNFLKQDLIDEMIITTIPIILGGGIPLFTEQGKRLNFSCVKSLAFSNGICQNHFVRKRS
jgi:dihydrofolate reductase